MQTTDEWFKDCESICFDCGGKPFKVLHPGVALCLRCYAIDLFVRLTDSIDNLIRRIKGDK